MNPKPLLRRGQVVEWLAEFGIAAWQVRLLLESGQIRAVRTRPNARAYYLREQIEKDVLRNMQVEN